MWDQLPELILIRIFRNLTCEDRFNVSGVCQVWRRGVAAPALWRSVTILIDRDLTSGFPLATLLAGKYGEHMRSLELAWSRPYVLSKETRNSANVRAQEGVDFLTALKVKEVQLKEFILTNWYFGTNWNYRGKILYALNRFIGSQNSLETLSIVNSNLGVTDVSKLLRAVTVSSGDGLKSLDLRGAFKDWQIPHNSSKYLRHLGRLHALNNLQLDYPSISNQCLLNLANGAPNSLRNLHISIRNTDHRQHTIDDSAWQTLVSACPQLTVSYNIVNISHFEDMSYLLQPSVPMARFQMYSGHVWEQSRSRNFRSTVGLLVTYYSSTLVEVILQLRNNREDLDDLLVSMLQRCKLLTTLRFDGIIRSLDTLSEILKLQSERITQFKTIHVRPRRVNMQNREILSDICYRFNRGLRDQGVNFKVQHPGNSIFYY
ncbi:F-box only protein 39-like [Diachasma alloeum]|uniref:F-box only protein 39-like n=1 Tax=Diachasma alloeum TaxID=454923 RepID=UPI00073842AA|nr:F-box only protein 39-like [Diachasma alloeum]